MLSSPFCSHSDLASSGRQPSKSGAQVFFLKHLTGAVLVELPPRVMKNLLFGSWAERRALALLVRLLYTPSCWVN